jgi:hypothetical protein
LTEAPSSATVAAVSVQHPAGARALRAPLPSLASWKRGAVTFGPLIVAVALLAERTIAAIVLKVGHPGAALDDAYIHFQYARAIAEGHPFRFQAGAPPTSGATSLLWPALLAPCWALGFRDEAILSFGPHGLCRLRRSAALLGRPMH